MPLWAVFGDVSVSEIFGLDEGAVSPAIMGGGERVGEGEREREREREREKKI